MQIKNLYSKTKHKIFYVIKDFGIARGVIFLFTACLLLLAIYKKMQIVELISDSFLRIGRNGILVLSLLPCIKGGLGLNFGLPLGVLCGLVGLMISMEYNIAGLSGFITAIVIGCVVATGVGFLYGKLLNKVKGQEMVVGTYIGFAAVSIMGLFWLMAPFRNPKLTWAIGGTGLRTTVPLDGYYIKILDNLLKFDINGVTIPSGLLIMFFVTCLFVFLFFKTRLGMSITAAGINEKFARASSINPNYTRVIATILSTVLAAFGIIVYSQSFGFVQIYTAPLLVAFPIVACLLIGGANVYNVTMFHVVFGTIVFQTLLTTALPVTSQFVKGDLSEVARIIISNGIILYALTGISQKSLK